MYPVKQKLIKILTRRQNKLINGTKRNRRRSNMAQCKILNQKKNEIYLD